MEAGVKRETSCAGLRLRTGGKAKPVQTGLLQIKRMVCSKLARSAW